jgi:hypothetical protein
MRPLRELGVWYIILLIIAVAGKASPAQTTAYQDATALSSLYLMNSKANLTYNVSDSKFTIGYLHEPNITSDTIATKEQQLNDDKTTLAAIEKHPPTANATDADTKAYQKQLTFYNAEIKALEDLIRQSAPKHPLNPQFGVSFSGKPSTNLGGQIFQTSTSPATISGGGSFGIHGVRAVPPVILDADRLNGNPHVLQDDSLFVYADYTRSTFDTVPAASSTVTVQHFNGFDILPTYNALLSHNDLSFLLGVSGGVNRSNNSGSLTKVLVNTTNAQSGTVSIVTQQNAYQGVYQVSTGVPIYSDCVLIPKKTDWLSIDFFERANVVHINGYAEGGVGVFVAQPKKPTNVLGGVSIAWKNGKSMVAVVAGWSF